MLFNIISFPLFLKFPLLSLLNYKDTMSLYVHLYFLRTSEDSHIQYNTNEQNT